MGQARERSKGNQQRRGLELSDHFTWADLNFEGTRPNGGGMQTYAHAPRRRSSVRLHVFVRAESGKDSM